MPHKALFPPAPRRKSPKGFLPSQALRQKRLVLALLAVPGFVPVLAHAQLSGDAAAPVLAGSPWDLRLAPQLEEHSSPANNKVAAKPALFVLADQTSGTSDQDTAAKGHAELRRGGSVVKADQLHYDVDTDTADAYGNVTVSNGGVVFSGPEAHLRVEAGQGSMPTPKYHFTTTGGSGSAQQVQMLDSERSIFTDATYTGCKCEEDGKSGQTPAWYIKGDQFTFDTGEDEGTAKNGVLVFQGVPVFASPWLTFPLSDQRESGFLPPTLSMNSTNGFDLALPYYFNIAPNRDLTLTPEIIARRGLFTTANFRYLSTDYSGSFTGQFLPDDMQTGTNRYAIYWQHQQNLGNGFGAYINYNRVSDAQFPEQLGADNTFLNGYQTLFQQEAGLTYNHGPWSVLARIQDWQTLPPSVAPYDREPELNVKYNKYDVNGFDYGMEADYSRFTISTAAQPEGDRVTFAPYVAYGVTGPGYFFTPKAQLHVASYNLWTAEGGIPGQPRQFTNSIPTFSLDTGLIFDRSVRLFGADMIQTLEPRLYYVYTPYRNQLDAPLFDTAASDFGLAEIFQPNTYVGNDRIADANRVTAALTSRFLDADSGDERARFVIAQEYYFQNQRVTLDSTQTQAQAQHSDLIVGGSLKLGAGFGSEAAFQYNGDNDQLIKSSVGFAYSPEAGKVLSVAYRYTRANTTLDYEPINQILISGQWPITHRFSAMARINYDLSAHSLVDGLAGFQYDADCWQLGIGVQRYANGESTSGLPTSSTGVMMQLTLKGLTTVDNGLVSAFKAAVPGYVPPPVSSPPLSRFSDYQ